VRDYAIFALDAKGHIATWNEGARRLKGYAAEEIVGRHFSVFYPAEDVAAGKPDYELVVAEAEGRVEDEGWRLRKDGSRFWANVVITALFDEHGELTGFGKVTRDLTERRLADQALRESEERFRLLVNGVEDYGIFLLDPGGRVMSWNEGAARQSGYSTGDILGRHFSVFYPSDDVAAGLPALELRTAEREGRHEEEGWRLRRDGSQFWSSVVITTLRRPNGELFGYAQVTRDLTERRAAEARALLDARQLAEAEAASRAKSDFLAAMSHELRTPLNAIAGYVDVLSLGIRGPLTREQESDLERIRRSQRHLLGIVNDLINFSSIEAGRIVYDIRPLDLGQIVDSVRAMVEPQAAVKEIEVQ
jgi:PAS domain S-box-containing protein